MAEQKSVELVEKQSPPPDQQEETVPEDQQQAPTSEEGDKTTEQQEGTSVDLAKPEEKDKLKDLLESKWEEISKEAIELLQKLIRTDTQNFRDEGTEMQAVLVLKEKFDEVGIPYEIIEPKSGRGNIVARVTGDGSSSKGAILLSAHLDTVRAPKENWEEEGWKHSPYSGEIDEEDGCLYGRGAVDMKNMAAMSVVLLCFIKRNGVILSRDLIFAALADEERTDSTYGVKYLVENHPDLIEADVIFNEVGGFSMFVDGRELFPIQIAEKGSAQIKISAKGPGGHGSLFHKNNPVATIGEVAQKLGNTRLPLRVVNANRLTIDGLASLLPFPKSTIFRRLLSPRFSDFVLERLLTEDQQSSIGPMLHNTANPTVIGGGMGDQYNQIPTSAWVIVDSRILPECTVDDAVHDIQQVLGASRFQTSRDANNEEIPPELEIEVLCFNNPLFQDPTEEGCPEVIEVIRNVISARADGAPVIHTMIPGGTDAFYYVQHPKKKPICLGFTPLRCPKDLRFVKLFHGTNERIPVEGFKWGIRVLSEVVCKICNAKVE